MNDDIIGAIAIAITFVVTIALIIGIILLVPFTYNVFVENGTMVSFVIFFLLIPFSISVVPMIICITYFISLFIACAIVGTFESIFESIGKTTTFICNKLKQKKMHIIKKYGHIRKKLKSTYGKIKYRVYMRRRFGRKHKRNEKTR